MEGALQTIVSCDPNFYCGRPVVYGKCFALQRHMSTLMHASCCSSNQGYWLTEVDLHNGSEVVIFIFVCGFYCFFLDVQ